VKKRFARPSFFALVFGLSFLSLINAACGTKEKTDSDERPEDPALNLATTYNEKVAPILADKCAPCHNAGGKLVGYANDASTFAAANKAALLDRINRPLDAKGVMPPTKVNKPLSPEEKGILVDYLNRL